MKDSQESRAGWSGTQLLLALLGGAAAGAGAALLLAPRSGDVTRARLRGAALEAKGAAQRLPHALAEAAGAAQKAFSQTLATQIDANGVG